MDRRQEEMKKERDAILKDFREGEKYFEKVQNKLPFEIQLAIRRLEKHHKEEVLKSPTLTTLKKCEKFQEDRGMLGWEIFFCPETYNYPFVIENIRPFDVVYDACAGDLRLDLVLSQKCSKVYAVEIDPRIIGKAIEIIGFDMPSNLIPICTDALEFPLPPDVTTIVILHRHLLRPLPEYWKKYRMISNANFDEPIKLKEKEGSVG